MTLPMSRADKVHCFSHLASVGVYLSYSQTRGVLSHQNVSAQKSLQYLLKNLGCFITLGEFSLVFAEADSFILNSDFCRIGWIENPSCSACDHLIQDTSHFILFCRATNSLRRLLFENSYNLSNFLVLFLRSYPDPWSHCSSAMALS